MAMAETYLEVPYLGNLHLNELVHNSANLLCAAVKLKATAYNMVGSFKIIEISLYEFDVCAYSF